jgi:fimbrial chaperone protein
LALAGLLMLASHSDGARATSLEILPVTVHLLPGAKATTVEVMNRGGLPAAIHLRAYAWSQDGDKDVLSPAPEIIISPPIFTLPKGATQTIRLMLRGGAAPGTERTYRLLIDEVPPTNSTEQKIHIAMRISVPIIVGSAGASTHNLGWSAQRAENGSIILAATNRGSSFERVQAIAVTLADGSQPAVRLAGANSYILAGARRQWVIETGGAARELRLSLTTRSGKSEQVLAVAQ